jgi:hypothetical protein
MMTNEEKFAEYRSLHSEEDWEAMVAVADLFGRRVHTRARIAGVVLPDVPWDQIPEADRVFFGMAVSAFFDETKAEEDREDGAIRITRSGLAKARIIMDAVRQAIKEIQSDDTPEQDTPPEPTSTVQ